LTVIVERWSSTEDGYARDQRYDCRTVERVVLLRGVNVGGHRTFRPTHLAKQLKHLDVVNIGAAGTFVIRASATRAELRAEFTRKLPFEAEIVICDGRELTRMVAENPFAGEPVPPDVVRFVSILARRSRSAPAMPATFPPHGPWLLRVLAADNRFVIGFYRRHMKVIGYLGALDRMFGVPVTTRNWNTVTAIAAALTSGRKLEASSGSSAGLSSGPSDSNQSARPS
jgi:uncharacterized protein (DUF1697 family)